MLDLSPEQTLLVSTASLDLSPEASDRISGILKNGIKWPLVESMAERLRVTPLLYKHLSVKTNAYHVPEVVLNQLRRGYRLQAMRNLRIYGQLKHLLALLNQAEIPVILVKGSYLARWVYGDLALRPMGDVDILVPKADARKAQQLLMCHGYEEMTVVFQSRFHEELENTLLENNHLLPVRPKRGVWVEIHKDLFTKAPRRSEILTLVWERALPLDLDGQKAFAPCPEDILLHLTLHLYSHMRSGKAVLNWFIDLDIFIRRYEGRLQWKQVMDAAEAMGIRTWIGTVLNMMARYWQSPVPVSILEHGERGAPLSLERILFSGSVSHRNFISERLRMVRCVGESYGWVKAAYFILRHLAPTRDCLVHRYNPKTRKDLYGAYAVHFGDRFRFAFSSLHGIIKTFRQNGKSPD